MAIKHQHQLDKTFHALGDGTRRKMLAMLAKRGECTASDLGRPFNIAQPSVSKHIRVLEQAGLVSRRIEGRTHRFHLIIKRLNDAQDWIACHRAAVPPTKPSYRSKSLCPLPMVAKLCDKVSDV